MEGAGGGRRVMLFRRVVDCFWMNLQLAFRQVFEENSLEKLSKKLYVDNGLEEVQNALTEHLPAKVHEEEMKGTPAFIDLCLKATEINKHLSDIQKLTAQLEKCWMECCSDENSEKQKPKLIEETKRLIKVMEKIAVLLKIPLLFRSAPFKVLGTAE